MEYATNSQAAEIISNFDPAAIEFKTTFIVVTIIVVLTVRSILIKKLECKHSIWDDISKYMKEYKRGYQLMWQKIKTVCRKKKDNNSENEGLNNV